jgi:hypothetical protein
MPTKLADFIERYAGPRLISRGGYNWTDRYPCIEARKVRQKRFVLDGEAVVLGVDSVSDFNALHSLDQDEGAGDDDLRGLPLSMGKTSLARLLARRPDGIFVAPFEQAGSGRTYSVSTSRPARAMSLRPRVCRANKLVLIRLSPDGLEGARSADERPHVNQMA